jgi:hypothetical protein
MVSLKDVQTAYGDPDLMSEAKNHDGDDQNSACEVSSRTRVIKLLDGKVNYGENQIYVPGESFLISYEEAERVVNSRKRLSLHGANVFPAFVDYVTENNGKYKGFLGRLTDETKKDLEKWCENEKGLEEIMAFDKIRKNRRNDDGEIDNSGLVLVQGVDPISPLRKGYELNGVFHGYDRLGRIDVPTQVTAQEAEFTFLSDDHVKITDGNGGVGKYKDGILTLEEPTIFVNEIERRVIKEEETSGKWRGAFENIPLGMFAGGILGGFGGAVTAGVVSAAAYGIGKLFGAPMESFGAFYLGGVVTTTTGSTILGGALVGLEGRSNEVKGYTPKGSAPLKIAFHGRVKDKRFENLEEFLL